MSFLQVRSLTKTYTMGERRLPVLRGLDLTLTRGEMVAVVGASGVGKSTLLQVVGGLDRIDGGSIRIGELDIAAADDNTRVAFRNRQVGFVFQFHHLLPEFTAVENVAMPLRIARVSPGEVLPRAEIPDTQIVPVVDETVQVFETPPKYRAERKKGGEETKSA